MAKCHSQSHSKKNPYLLILMMLIPFRRSSVRFRDTPKWFSSIRVVRQNFTKFIICWFLFTIISKNSSLSFFNYNCNCCLSHEAEVKNVFQCVWQRKLEWCHSHIGWVFYAFAEIFLYWLQSPRHIFHVVFLKEESNLKNNLMQATIQQLCKSCKSSNNLDKFDSSNFVWCPKF